MLVRRVSSSKKGVGRHDPPLKPHLQRHTGNAVDDQGNTWSYGQGTGLGGVGTTPHVGIQNGLNFQKFAEHLLAFSRLASIQQHPSPFYTSIRRSTRFRHPRRFEKPPATGPTCSCECRKCWRSRPPVGLRAPSERRLLL